MHGLGSKLLICRHSARVKPCASSMATSTSKVTTGKERGKNYKYKDLKYYEVDADGYFWDETGHARLENSWE